MITDITNTLAITAFLGALFFVIRYFRTRWFAQAMGIHLMAFMVVICLILGLAAATSIWGDFWNRTQLRFIDYILLNIIIWWRVFLLFGIQRRRGKKVQS